MAIPIRLTLANGKDEIDLVAQSLDMSINRNVSAFPTPNNLLQRFAVDTNIPSIKIDINGIFVDDEGFSVDSGRTVTFYAETMRTAINFGDLLPTKPVGAFIPVVLSTHNFGSGTRLVYTDFIASEEIPKGQKSTISLSAPVGDPHYDASSFTEQFNVKPYTNFQSTHARTSGVHTEIVLVHSFSTSLLAVDFFTVGDRLIKENGDIIGTIQSISGNTITFTGAISNNVLINERIHSSVKAFNHFGQQIGFADYLIDDSSVSDGDPAIYTLGLTDVNDAVVISGQMITLNRKTNILERFRNQCIKVIPSYWLENQVVPLLTRDSSMERAPSSHGTSNSTTNNGHIPRVGVRLDFDLNTAYTTSPSLTTAAVSTISTNAASVDAVINVPIKDIDTADNPALAMAEQVKKALDGTVITGNIVNAFSRVPGFNPAGDKTLASAFTVTQNGVVVVIEQVYKPNIDILHPSCLSPDLTDIFTRDVEFHSRGSTPSESKKSAGDKVQDLIGLVSNANRNSDLLRGIQIPYDSLVTSTGVTGVARNFFTTFGEIDISQKGSEFNSASASIPMQNLLLGMSDGGAGGESPDKWYDSLLDLPVVSELESIFGFLVGAGQQLWVTLTDKASGVNSGGIRIIPEKLHVRYDAGNNYYAFNLELMASDYVIGV